MVKIGGYVNTVEDTVSLFTYMYRTDSIKNVMNVLVCLLNSCTPFSKSLSMLFVVYSIYTPDNWYRSVLALRKKKEGDLFKHSFGSLGTMANQKSTIKMSGLGSPIHERKAELKITIGIVKGVAELTLEDQPGSHYVAAVNDPVIEDG
ncbi:hypothetical protein L1987_60468 [Smallanthus sonchifolius]|uniref:Uncharacterized protein n=1 Tax=Smallanthus sonchifolius TaxID=185202 RepID=A0ACB9D8R9_9ASTR|nr:hypothetical protein L1987_60468 [Smallanthus sonchifolius]